MKHYDYLIIGGGIAGTVAAETIRKYDEKGSVAIISEEPYRLYSRIQLTKRPFFLGEKRIDDIFLRKSDSYQKQKIDCIFGKRVERVDIKRQSIVLSDGVVLLYSKLLLAHGGKAQMHENDTGTFPQVLSIRNLDDIKNIFSLLPNVKKAVIVGSGFISFECADLLSQKDIDVMVVFRKKHYWERVLDTTAERIVVEAMKKNVALVPQKTVQSFNGEKKLTSVSLSDNTVIDADLAISGVGMTVDSHFIKDTNITTHSGILADEFLQTSQKNIWVAGDAAEYNDILLDSTIHLGNWVNAHMQGRAVGYNMTHELQKPYSHISSYTSSGFGMTLSFVGDVRIVPERKILARGPKDKSYGQLIFHSNRLVGAVLINRGQDIIPLSKLIAQKITFDSYHNELKDITFDLKKIL